MRNELLTPNHPAQTHALQRGGVFFKAAHGFSDLSGWFTFHVEWTGGDRRNRAII